MTSPSIKLSFPQTNLKNSDKELISEYIDSQGYSRKTFKSNMLNTIEREVNINDYQDYLISLFNKFFSAPENELSSLKKPDFESFKIFFDKHRHSIINFEDIFFFHYSQIASSLKSTYESESQQLSKKYSMEEQYLIKDHIEDLKSKVDNVFKSSFKQIHKICHEVFINALKQSLNNDGTFDIQQLNQYLNKWIKPTKETCDVIFKESLKNQDLPIYTQATRKMTTAFGGETIIKTKTQIGDKTFSQETYSTPITSHTKKRGPAITKVVLKDNNKILHQSLRTSHLVTGKTKKEEAIQTIEQFMNNRFNKEKPLIYNLYTSVHSGDISPVGLQDGWSNQQTKRLRTLLNGQKEFNKKQKNINDMFFTINTPTNTYGQEITLESTDPLIKEAAISNSLGLAIILFDEKNSKLKETLKSYQEALENQNFSKVISNLKDLQKEASNIQPQNPLKEVKEELIQRFINDDAATHSHAKISATCIAILSTDSANFNLIEGCKSGNERTGNILGRVATFFKHPPEQLSELDQHYNRYGLYNHFSSSIACNDMGAPPKTTVKTDKFLPNTNETEDKSMTNLQSSKMSVLQSHKDKSFDNTLPHYSMNIAKLAIPAIGIALGLGITFACPPALIIPIVSVIAAVVIYNVVLYALDLQFKQNIHQQLIPSQLFKQSLENQESKNPDTEIQIPSLAPHKVRC